MSINLITSFYLPDNPNRRAELIKCLQKNINCPYIETIHLYVDDKKALNYIKETYTNLIKTKIIIISMNYKPKYSDLFKYANTLSGKQCMISNSDIWLSSLSNEMVIQLAKNDTIFSLTRYEHDMTKPLIENYCGSHDCFIFTSPLKEDLIKHVNHYQNILGSENVVLYELQKYGYKIINPCFDIVIVHEHKSAIRSYAGKRMNHGGLDGDGVYKVRSHRVPPKKI